MRARAHTATHIHCAYLSVSSYVLIYTTHTTCILHRIFKVLPAVDLFDPLLAVFDDLLLTQFPFLHFLGVRLDQDAVPRVHDTQQHTRPGDLLRDEIEDGLDVLLAIRALLDCRAFLQPRLELHDWMLEDPVLVFFK